MLKSSVGYMALVFVTPLWLWVGDRKPFWGRRGRDQERCVEHRLNVALVAHKMHFAATFNEAFALLVDALVTLGVVFSDGPSLDRNQYNTGMMVPASGASGFKDNLYNRKICRTSPAFHFDALVLGFEVAQSCSRYLGCGHRGALTPEVVLASAAPTTTARRARTLTPTVTNKVVRFIIYPFSFPYLTASLEWLLSNDTSFSLPGQ